MLYQASGCDNGGLEWAPGSRPQTGILKDADHWHLSDDPEAITLYHISI